MTKNLRLRGVRCESMEAAHRFYQEYKKNERKARELYLNFCNEIKNHICEKRSETGAKSGTPAFSKKKNSKNNGDGNYSRESTGAQVQNEKTECGICKAIGRKGKEIEHRPYKCENNPHNENFDGSNERWTKIKDVVFWNKPFDKKYWKKKVDDGNNKGSYTFDKRKYEQDTN